MSRLRPPTGKNWAKGRTTETEKLVRALMPFVEAYEKARDPVGDSDLYNEQPRSVSVTLGDCRRASSALHQVMNPETYK